MEGEVVRSEEREDVMWGVCCGPAMSAAIYGGTVAEAVFGNGTRIPAGGVGLAVGTPDSTGKVEPARENTAAAAHSRR